MKTDGTGTPMCPHGCGFLEWQRQQQDAATRDFLESVLGEPLLDWQWNVFRDYLHRQEAR